VRFEEFLALAHGREPPPELPLALLALLRDARGDWEGAHDAAQRDDGRNGAWVHAYLHRKEGDLSNASYWYGRAGRDNPDVSLEREWELIARDIVER
jgi:hypothetical protein